MSSTFYCQATTACFSFGLLWVFLRGHPRGHSRHRTRVAQAPNSDSHCSDWSTSARSGRLDKLTYDAFSLLSMLPWFFTHVTHGQPHFKTVAEVCRGQLATHYPCQMDVSTVQHGTSDGRRTIRSEQTER
ncbi:hypothetical protein BDV97DRAFT_346907 [Delphinella strobiligena]|nr:hypothetical protein BDV97DRAFT_346907 [Delphinella strobiligena]